MGWGGWGGGDVEAGVPLLRLDRRVGLDRHRCGEGTGARGKGQPQPGLGSLLSAAVDPADPELPDLL